MKTTTLLIALITFSSCQFNKSVNKDLITGAYSSVDNIEVNHVEIEVNGKSEKRNEFVFGEKVNFIFHGVTGLTKEDNKFYPRLSMHIVKNEKDTVYTNSGLLIKPIEVEDGMTVQLNAKLNMALPYRNKESYKAIINIWDAKGDGKYYYELPFRIKENKFLKIESKGIKYSNVYLYNQTLKQAVFKKNINIDHKYILIIDDLEGLEIINKKAFPVFSIDLADNNGNRIVRSANVLSDYESSGVNPLELKNQLTATITFSKGQMDNPCKLVATLKDSKSSKELIISSELIIN